MPDEGGEGQHPEEHTPDPGPDQGRLHAFPDPLAIALPLRRLLHKALHRPDLTERFLRHRRRFGDLVLHPHGHPPEPAPEVQRRADHQRNHPQGGQGEPRLHQGEQDDAAHQGQDLAGEFRDLVAQHSLQQSNVGGEPAGKLAGPALGEESGRHLQQLGEELPPKSRHHALAHRAQQVGLGVVEHGLHAEQDHQPDGNPVQDGPVLPDERRIEQKPDDHGKRQAEDGADDESEGRQAEHPPEGLHP